MRNLLIVFLLISFSFAMAISVFQQEVADSLVSQLSQQINSDDSYCLIPSDNQYLDSYIMQQINKLGADIRIDKSLASKLVHYSITSDISYLSKRSFLFNRQVKQEKYRGEAKIVDNETSQIEHYCEFSKIEESPFRDENITIWKPVLISLITGSLIYSLWSIE